MLIIRKITKERLKKQETREKHARGENETAGIGEKRKERRHDFSHKEDDLTAKRRRKSGCGGSY